MVPHSTDICVKRLGNGRFLDQELMEPLKRKGILIRNCSNYRGLTKGYYRIAVKTEEENRQLIDAIRDVIDNTDLR